MIAALDLAPRYRFNDRGTIVTPQTGIDSSRMMLVEVASAAGTKRFAMPEALVTLLTWFDGAQDLDAIDRRLATSTDPFLRALQARSQLKQFVEGFCVPAGLLSDGHEPPPPADPARTRAYLFARLRLIPESITVAIARRLHWLFAPALVAIVLVASAVVHVVFYGWLVGAYHIHLTRVSGSEFGVIAVLSILAAVVHEFGHASALVRYGCTHVSIGIGWYIWQPVLYADVSEAWRLEQRQRACVDVGGIYFHLIAQALLVALFALTRQTVLLYVVLSIDAAVAFSLHPFLRMDGYWLVADLLGVWDARRQSRQIVKRLWSEWREARRPPAVRSTELALLAYVAGSLLFFAYLIVTLGEQVVLTVIPRYPAMLAQFLAAFRHATPAAEVVGLFFGLLWRSMLILVCARAAWRVVRRAIDRLDLNLANGRRF